jgi:hypothetical protein
MILLELLLVETLLLPREIVVQLPSPAAAIPFALHFERPKRGLLHDLIFHFEQVLSDEIRPLLQQIIVNSSDLKE